MNRLHCSNVYLSNDNKIVEIPERLRHFGNSIYNKELAQLEEYVIQNFPNIYVIDISKYFIPDQQYNPDTTPVHYEEKYNLLLSNIYEDIISCERVKYYYDTLPIQMVIDLLNRPVSTDDFLKIYSERELPFCTDTFLDFILKQQNITDIATNRGWIATLYQKYFMIQEELRNSDYRLLLKMLLENDALWNETEFFKEMVYKYLCDIQSNLELSIPQLYEDFLQNFNNELTEKWILQLNVLSIIAPDYEQVSTYLLEYYNATDNNTAFLKTILNQKQL